MVRLRLSFLGFVVNVVAVFLHIASPLRIGLKTMVLTAKRCGNDDSGGFYSLPTNSHNKKFQWIGNARGV
jgi:hypothetical protein